MLTVVKQNIYSTFLFSDITYFVGSGSNQAGFVIDWNDGQAPLAWGYRWDDPATPTGFDMLSAIVTSDSRLSNILTFGTFIQEYAYTRDILPNSSENSSPFLGNFWGYYVNASQEAGNFTSTTHGTPNGDPYGGTGTFFLANTGGAGRPLTNGSWDVWFWNDGTSIPSTDPVAAQIPELKLNIFLIILISYYICINRFRKKANL